MGVIDADGWCQEEPAPFPQIDKMTARNETGYSHISSDLIVMFRT